MITALYWLLGALIVIAALEAAAAVAALWWLWRGKHEAGSS